MKYCEVPQSKFLSQANLGDARRPGCSILQQLLATWWHHEWLLLVPATILKSMGVPRGTSEAVLATSDAGVCAAVEYELRSSLHSRMSLDSSLCHRAPILQFFVIRSLPRSHISGCGSETLGQLDLLVHFPKGRWGNTNA